MSSFFINSYLSGGLPSGAPASPITWTGKVNVTETSPSSLEKTSGGGSVWNAGAHSVEQAASGYIKVECTLPTAATQGILGINNAALAAVDQNFTNIRYGLFAFSGSLYSVTNGAVSGALITYIAGDKMAVEVLAGQVRYLKNGVVFGTVSSPSLSYPLVADCSIQALNAKLNSCTITF